MYRPCVDRRTCDNKRLLEKRQRKSAKNTREGFPIGVKLQKELFTIAVIRASDERELTLLPPAYISTKIGQQRVNVGIKLPHQELTPEYGTWSASWVDS